MKKEQNNILSRILLKIGAIIYSVNPKVVSVFLFITFALTGIVGLVVEKHCLLCDVINIVYILISIVELLIFSGMQLSRVMLYVFRYIEFIFALLVIVAEIMNINTEADKYTYPIIQLIALVVMIFHDGKNADGIN